MYVTKITAHSGAENTPANSVEFIETALSCGADGLEVDIWQIEDSIVLSHDRPQKIGDGVDINELFSRLAKTDKYVNCDCKHIGIAKNVMETALKSGVKAEQIIFTGSVSGDEIPYLKGTQIYRNAEGLGIDGLFKEPLDYSLVEKAAKICADSKCGINLNYNGVDLKSVEIIKSFGVKITVWTVDKEEIMHKMLDFGVDYITTNRPCTVLKIKNL